MPALCALFPSGSGYESPGDAGVHWVLPVERAPCPELGVTVE